MRRITEIFEERLIAKMKAALSEAEQSEIDYEVCLAPYPAMQPDGSQGVNMGVSVSLVMRSTIIIDHIMVTGLVQDPFCTDAILDMNVQELLAGLRERKAASGSFSNGGLYVPGARG